MTLSPGYAGSGRGRGRGLLARLAFEHHPALALADRAALLDPHPVTDLVLVGFVVRRELARALDDLLVDRVHDAAFDQDNDRLVHLVAHHDTLHDALRHCSNSDSGA